MEPQIATFNRFEFLSSLSEKLKLNGYQIGNVDEGYFYQSNISYDPKDYCIFENPKQYKKKKILFLTIGRTPVMKVLCQVKTIYVDEYSSAIQKIIFLVFGQENLSEVRKIVNNIYTITNPVEIIISVAKNYNEYESAI